MTALKNFLIFGIVVAATVLFAQTALGATRAAVAKPAAHVAAFQPERHSAKAVSPARMRVQVSALGRFRASGVALYGPRR
jgi:hypothetical protein